MYLIVVEPVGLKKMPRSIILFFRGGFLPIPICLFPLLHSNLQQLIFLPPFKISYVLKHPASVSALSMDMDCMENCWILSPPSLPPPPPIPQFLAYLNLTLDCDLCSWAGVTVSSPEGTEGNSIHLSSLLIIVGVISACCGAGIMAALLSIKRIRGFRSTSSVRHLARKESNRIGPSLTEGFTSSSLTENNYCDGPYSTGDKDLTTSCNIYAELHEPRIDNVWTRPRTSPPIENCYLELTDLPTAFPPTVATKRIRPWFLEQSPNSSSYYSDFELTKSGCKNTSSPFHHPQPQ